MENSPSLNLLLQEAVTANWNRPALTDLGSVTYQYRDLAEEIEKVKILFEAAGVNPGDHVAICGKNSSNWAIVFLACLTSGRVAVPILHEFTPETIHHLVNHSGSKLLFVDPEIWHKLDEKLLPDLTGVFFIAERGMPLSRSKRLTQARDTLNLLFGEKFPAGFGPADVKFYHDSPDELAIINYTSGSTGMSKGVMLPYRSIWSNIRFCLDNIPFVKAGDGFVNMLPLAHLYGMVIEMLNPIAHGCHCYFLTRLPSPHVLLAAFAEVRPKLIITVPLVLEKIIRNNVFPKIKKPLMRLMLSIPGIREKIEAKIRAQLIKVFGGQLEELIIGGAPLNPEVDEFLSRIGFPLTVGYGMTECGPLLTYVEAAKARRGSVGKPTDRMQIKIESPDPVNIPGNLWVKGDNVMLGYYRNPEATKEVMPDNSGWMNTGDMGHFDSDGYIYISGRSKTMILGPSGQNIYPEEIEHKLNSLPLVAESVVVDRNHRLVALVFPDPDKVQAQHLSEAEVKKIIDADVKLLNKDLPSYSKISAAEILPHEFEKTPKRSIKRYLYK